MVQQVQPLLHPAEPLPVKLHIRHVLGDLPVEITEQGVNVLKLIGKLLRPVIVALHAAQFAHRIADSVRRRLFTVSGELVRLVCRLDDLPAVCHSPVIALDLLVLARCQPGFLDLLILELRKGEFLRLRPVICAEHRKLPLELRIQLIALPEFLLDRGKRFPCKGIEDLHMIFLVQERLVLMLAVNVDQKLGKRLDLFRRDGLPAYPEQVAAGLDLSLYNDDAVLLHRDLKRLDLLQHRRVCHLEDQLHKRIVGACPYHILVRSRPQCEIDRADDDRFAGSGLPAQDIQSSPKIDLCL